MSTTAIFLVLIFFHIKNDKA